MARYIASDRRAVEVQIEGARTGSSRTLRADAKGFYEVNDKSAAKALKESGFIEASLMGTTTTKNGHLCSKCGFNGWFAVCGKCGHDSKGEENVEA